LMEIPPQDQIEYLLGQNRISEAIDIFSLKDAKGADFKTRHKQFNLDIGWVYLTKQLDFDNVVHNFKNNDIDPRELILLL